MSKLEPGIKKIYFSDTTRQKRAKTCGKKYVVVFYQVDQYRHDY